MFYWLVAQPQWKDKGQAGGLRGVAAQGHRHDPICAMTEHLTWRWSAADASSYTLTSARFEAARYCGYTGSTVLLINHWQESCNVLPGNRKGGAGKRPGGGCLRRSPARTPLSCQSDASSTSFQTSASTVMSYTSVPLATSAFPPFGCRIFGFIQAYLTFCPQAHSDVFLTPDILRSNRGWTKSSWQKGDNGTNYSIPTVKEVLWNYSLQ